jgi:hypothetical protein
MGRRSPGLEHDPSIAATDGAGAAATEGLGNAKKPHDMRYCVLDVPNWPEAIVLGFQVGPGGR